MPVKAGYLITAGAGAIILWSGLTGKKWTAVLRDVIAGQDPRTAMAANQIQATPPGAFLGNPISGAPPGAPGQPQGLFQAGTGNPTASFPLVGPKVNQANRVAGMLLATAYGWAPGTTDWKALDYGWGTLESGWDNTALNGSWPSGAYGIPQAHPGNKMPQAAWPSYAGGSSSVRTQILWGLSYIKQVYGRPSNVPGWLGQGGYQGY